MPSFLCLSRDIPLSPMVPPLWPPRRDTPQCALFLPTIHKTEPLPLSLTAFPASYCPCRFPCVLHAFPLTSPLFCQIPDNANSTLPDISTVSSRFLQYPPPVPVTLCSSSSSRQSCLQTAHRLNLQCSPTADRRPSTFPEASL